MTERVLSLFHHTESEEITLLHSKSDLIRSDILHDFNAFDRGLGMAWEKKFLEISLVTMRKKKAPKTEKQERQLSVKEDRHMLLPPTGRRANRSKKKGAVGFEPQDVGLEEFPGGFHPWSHR